MSLYWAAGGTALLSTVGGSVEDIGRQGGLPAVALGLAAAGLKLAGGILALALVRPWGRAIPRTWLLACATGASAVLACYGAIQVTAGSLVLSGAVRPAAAVDWTALRWHVLVWDMWFLIWGMMLAAAPAAVWRHAGTRSPPPRETAARNGQARLTRASRAGNPGAQATGACSTGTGPPAVAPRSAGGITPRVRARRRRRPCAASPAARSARCWAC